MFAKTYRRVSAFLSLFPLATGVGACDKGDAPRQQSGSTGAAVASIDAKAAKEVFDTRCAACHGANGKGDGPGAAALNPKPRDYSDKQWQSAVTDDQIRKTILLGGAAVGKSPIMPASPDLDAKPEVVEGLVKIVRGFRR
ncbi:MAG: c-type cytochrome [Polyangiaceae bacterium]|jgi:mono/diheme cytochrome c family protein|nr:c-type cytochrome [Polyangiaceae bacterium]